MTKKRQPIVAVLGHVDHGKTSLLDVLRKTNVAGGEAGGITQSIGASVVETKDGGKITFIDTPGHALFSGMRKRGANAADIALLVVDGSSGIKPQTKEAIEIITGLKIPFILVITKTDLPSASIEKVLEEFEREGIYFEGRGGQTPYIGVSAKNKINLNELLDLIMLLWDLTEDEEDKSGEFSAFVIETSKEKAGITVSVVVKKGSIKVGMDLYTNKAKGRVKGLFDSLNKPVKEIFSGEPAKILGFENLPDVGSQVFDKKIEIQEEAEKRIFVRHDKTKIPLFVKASNKGSLEAILASIPGEFVVIDSGIGDVSESDVLNAKANNSPIFVFESGFSGNIKKLADAEGVKLERFNVIYEFLEKLAEFSKEGQSAVLGKAEILAEFPYDGKKVAGAKIIQGTISKSNNILLLRNDIEIGKSKIVSIRKQKKEVVSAGQGEECGILLIPQLDFLTKDVIIAVKE